MDILQTLIKLREDIQTWVTNNLVALNVKIDANKVQTDDELNTSSTNPIQNKPVAERISNISDNDESGEFNLADPSGNVIFKADAEGIHTTDVEAENLITDGSDFSIADEQGNIIVKVDNEGLHTAGVEVQSISTGDSELAIADANGNMILKVDNEGIHTTNIEGNGEDFCVADANGNLIMKVDSDGVHTTDIEAKNIAAEDDNLTVADPQGNIIFKVDAGGIHTTDIEVNDTSIKEKASEWDAKSDFSGNYEDLIDKPELLDDASDSFDIVDSNGNIVAKIDAQGLKTVGIYINGVSLDERIPKPTADDEGKVLCVIGGEATWSDPESLMRESLNEINALIGEGV